MTSHPKSSQGLGTSVNRRDMMQVVAAGASIAGIATSSLAQQASVAAEASPADSFLSQFTLAPIGARSGNLARNAGRGPSFYTFDLGVGREWRFGEKIRLRPVVQFDNILNAAVFNYGAAFIDFTNLTLSNSSAKANFLVPTRTYRQRQLRLGIRFDF